MRHLKTCSKLCRSHKIKRPGAGCTPGSSRRWAWRCWPSWPWPSRHLATATLAVITPFAIGIVLAMLLDPLADRLERRGMSRTMAAALIFGVFVL